MHIVFYTHNILDLGSFNSALSWAIVIGGVYGCMRLARDLFALARYIHREPPPSSE